MNDFELSTAKKIISSAQKRKLFLLTVIYFIAVLMISVVDRFDVHLVIINMNVTANTIAGIFIGIIIAIAIFMTQAHYHYGFIISTIAMIIHTAVVSMSIFKMGNDGALPGLSFLLSGFVINTILHINLKRVQEAMLLNSKSAITDPLTGTYNRRGLTTYLEELIQEEREFYVLFVDLDNFKHINDTTGHSSGDHILNVMAARWMSIPKPNGIIARNGGDEYVIVIPVEPEVYFDINEYAQACVERAREEVFLKEKNIKFSTTASIGVAQFPDNGSTADEILANADIAMYESKKAGKNRFTVFGK